MYKVTVGNSFYFFFRFLCYYLLGLLISYRKNYIFYFLYLHKNIQGVTEKTAFILTRNKTHLLGTSFLNIFFSKTNSDGF
jgi:uncharacterized membrane protein